MTLLEALNEELKDLPNIFKELKEKILIERWDKAKLEQALKIVQELERKKGNLIKVVSSNTTYLMPTKLYLTLIPVECGIKNSATFTDTNMSQAIRYVNKLIADLNRISAKIQFSYGGHFVCKDDTRCEFLIDWTF